MDALDRKQAVSHFAQIHADEWRRGKANAEITNEIVSEGMREGLFREEALDVAADTLKYMRRYL